MIRMRLLHVAKIPLNVGATGEKPVPVAQASLPSDGFIGPGNEVLSMTGYGAETGNMVRGDGSAQYIAGNADLEMYMNQHLQATVRDGSNFPIRNMTFLRPSQIP